MVGPLKTFLSLLPHLCSLSNPLAQKTPSSEVLRWRWYCAEEGCRGCCNLASSLWAVTHEMRKAILVWSELWCWETWNVTWSCRTPPALFSTAEFLALEAYSKVWLSALEQMGSCK